MITDIETVTGIGDLMELAGAHRNRETEYPQPVLLVVGRITRSVDVDGTVIERIGQVDCEPAYLLRPRAYYIRENGTLVVCDDHEDWFEAGNEEEHTISERDVELVIVAEPATDELKTPEQATNVVIYPEVSEDG